MFRENQPGWLESVINEDEHEAAGTVSMTVTLFLELWQLLPHVEQAQVDVRLDWINRSQTLYGGISG